MKKTKHKFIFPFAVLAFGLMTYTSIMVNADDTTLSECEPLKRTFFFMEGSTYNKGEANSSYPTSFYDELPDEAEYGAIRVSERKMTQSDFEIYLQLVENGEDLGTGISGAPIRALSVGGKEYRSNSGTDTGWVAFTEAREIGVSTYWNKNIVAPSLINVYNCEHDGNHTISCNIDREWNDNTRDYGEYGRYDGDGTYTIPAIAEITIEYSAEDCAEEEEELSCDTSESKSVPDELNCSDGTYNEVVVEENVSTDRDKSDMTTDEYNFYDKKSDAGTNPVCDALTEKIIGTVTIEQNGFAELSTFPSSIYSGGGFSINAEYTGDAEYEICDGLTYEITDWYATYSCPPKSSSGPTSFSGSGYWGERVIQYGTGSLNETTKKCTYTETIIDTYYFYETDYENNPDYYSEYLCEYEPIYCPYSECSCSVTDSSGSVVENAEQDETCGFETTTYTCSTGYGSNCTNSSAEMQAFAKKMAEFIKNPDFKNTAEVKSKDSNRTTVDDNPDTIVQGTWDEDLINISEWYPGDTPIRYHAKFLLGKACIGIYPNEITNAPITYVGVGGDCPEETIDGGNYYYVPLKWPDGRKFPVSINVPEISIIPSLMNWSLDYVCGPDCYQKIYEEDGGFKFIYRPIDLSEPFPNNRTPGSNWTSFMSEYHSNDTNTAKNKMTRNKKEYVVVLTPTSISNLKNDTSGFSYSNLRSISINGQSNILGTYGITFEKRATNYNKLGECITTDDGDKKCWLSQR